MPLPLERLALAGLHCLEPEQAHDLSIRALRTGLVPLAGGPVQSPLLRSQIGPLALLNPIGLAAGFDKNAAALAPLARAGFGFLELGAVTPLAQPGNPKPRLFRLKEDRAVINRFGFNNEGMGAIAARLARAREGCQRRGVPVGLNLGANKDSADRSGDFARVLAHCGAHIDFATVNVSSPNTQGLRDLQGAQALRSLLARVMEARLSLSRPVPIFLKIAPDLEDEALAALAETALEAGVEAIIATNTTLAREGLQSAHKGEQGGLSGAPLFERSTRVLARLSQITQGKMPLIGVGGIASAAQAYEKIRAGASAIQLYTALAYEGLSLVPRIAKELEELLQQDGFTSAQQAVGTGRNAWL